MDGKRRRGTDHAHLPGQTRGSALRDMGRGTLILSSDARTHQMNRFGWMAAAALVLGACQNGEPPAEAAALPAAAAADTASPGDPEAASDAVLTAEGWGPLRIGMTLEEVTAAAGEDANPEAVGGPEPEVCDEFRPARAPEGMIVMVEDGRLTRISLAARSTMRTDRGFGVGVEAEAVAAAYGAAAERSPHKYVEPPAEYITVWSRGAGTPDARGIVYEIGGDGRVWRIHAGGPSIRYVEGCL